MIETRARVVAVASGTVWVEAAAQQGCAACQSRSSCGVSALGRFFSRSKPPVAVPCAQPMQPGDTLVLGLAESDLLRAGLLAYLLPTLLAVAGAIAANLAGHGDGAAAAATLAGFAVGLGGARLLARTPRLRISRSASPDPIFQGDPQ